MFEKMEKIQ